MRILPVSGVWFVILIVIGILIGGCVGGPQAMPAEFAGIVTKITDKAIDETVLDSMVSNMRGHVLNPGVEAYVVIELAAGARIKGMDGDVMLDTSGTGTKLPSGMREALIRQLDGPLSDEQRAAIFEILGWNRVQDPNTF